MDEQERDELRLKIAEYHGFAWKEWKDEHRGETERGFVRGYITGAWHYQGKLCFDDAVIPDWITKIAAAYQLEDEIPEDQRDDYTIFLAKVIMADDGTANWWGCAHATPEQRSRAYVAWKQAQP